MSIRFDPSLRTLWLSIGDLLGTLAFPGSIALLPTFRSRAALGRSIHASHQMAQQALHSSYRAEVTIRQEMQLDDYTIHIQGRIDGLYTENNTTIVEEIKSVLLPADAFATLAPGHYPQYEQQLVLYLLLLRQQIDTPLQGHLVLINAVDKARRIFVVEPQPQAYDQLITTPLRRILARCAARVARAAQRHAAQLRFPFATMRPHQEAMLEKVRHTIEEQRCILLAAPTGIGKTIAALYPALVYALQHGLRVFFVTAKTTQQTLAVETLQQLATQEPAFTAVHLRAKAKSCLNDVYYCHENVCEFAQDYTGKLERSGLVETLLQLPMLTPASCGTLGETYRVCPFELSLDVALEADVILGDYNYVFDPSAALRRFFQDTPYHDCILIIDEAHNLYNRGRDYYSPALSLQQIRSLRSLCADNPVRLFRDFGAFFDRLEDLFDAFAQSVPSTTTDCCPISPPTELFGELRQIIEALMVDYAIYRRRQGSPPARDALQEFYYDFQRFCDVLAFGGEEFSYLYYPHPEEAIFKILCKDASRFLHERLQGFHSVIAMSATLTPFPFYQDVLGMPPERTTTAAFPSPFPAHNRQVLVIPDVSTTYRDRQRDAPATARIIETIAAQRPGNYAVFFPSFAYLRLVRAWMFQHPIHSILEQTPVMAESEREAVLHRLQRHDPEPLLLLAVQGGIFAEGVDYPGDMLSGVIIIGPGLPRVDHEQELLRDYYETKYARGFAYAYLYPGMNRVIQAAGRLIRSETDIGIIALVDKRFGYSTYNALFPRHWYTRTPRELITRDYPEALQHFWSRHPSPRFP